MEVTIMENNTTKIQEQINALAKDEAFVEAYKKVETPAELVALFHKHGIEVPVETAKELFAPIVLDEELSENDLESVAGGGWFGKQIGKAIGGPVAFGLGYLGGRLAGWSKVKSVNYADKCEKFGAELGGLVGNAVSPY